MDKSILDAFLGKTLEYLNSTEAFLQKNVPAYVEELLLFNFYSALFGAIVTVSILAIALIFLWNYVRKYKHLSDDAAFFHGVGIFMVITIFGIASYCNILTAIKIKVAPRVYLVEKVSAQLASKK